ncbi:MAG TPA: hypothetical protein VHW09_09195 [Bryobacteraceae bacterium]|jgi:hypothetical protein|nr:hypothetical protein [Bryobacteraceae bacterium]
MHISAVLLAATMLVFESPMAAPKHRGAVYQVNFAIDDDRAATPQPVLHYSMPLGESRKAVFEALGGVPNPCGSPLYLDAGTKIELTLRPSGDRVAIEGAIDLSSVTGHVNLGSLCEPILGHRKIVLHADLGLGKQVKLARDEKGASMPEVEAVVTRVN